MKKLSVLALSAALMSTPALAESNQNYIAIDAASQALDSVDLSAVFENNDNQQVAILSKQEMQETEGAIVQAPLALMVLGGGAISAWGNHIASKKNTGQWASTKSTLIATGSGMATSAAAGTALTAMSIPTSLFSKTAWQGANGWANASVRASGFGLNHAINSTYQDRLSKQQSTTNKTTHNYFQNSMREKRDFRR